MITIGYMGKASRKPTPGGRNGVDIKSAFSARLNELCDENGIPPKGKNRQKTVGSRFSVSQEGARKWLEGEGLPQFEKCIEIAVDFKVCLDWLMTGRGPKRVAQAPVLRFKREEVEAARKVVEIADTYAEE